MKAEQVKTLYQRRAGRYDREIKLYKRLFFFDIERYRRIAVRRLGLVSGEVVLDIGCGTGLNLPLLQEGVGPDGRIIGLDVSPEMLAEAGARVRQAGWKNVTLVEGDATQETFSDVDAILSTYAFCLMPDPRQALRNAVAALKPGGRMAVMDMQFSRRWQGLLANPIALLAARPYGTMELRSWDMGREMAAALETVSFDEYYMGICYVAHGSKGLSSRPEARPEEVVLHGQATRA